MNWKNNFQINELNFQVISLIPIHIWLFTFHCLYRVSCRRIIGAMPIAWHGQLCNDICMSPRNVPIYVMHFVCATKDDGILDARRLSSLPFFETPFSAIICFRTSFFANLHFCSVKLYSSSNIFISIFSFFFAFIALRFFFITFVEVNWSFVSII